MQPNILHTVIAQTFQKQKHDCHTLFCKRTRLTEVA